MVAIVRCMKDNEMTEQELYRRCLILVQEREICIETRDGLEPVDRQIWIELARSL